MKNANQITATKAELNRAKILLMEKILRTLPSDITVDELKHSFIKTVIVRNDHNLTASARELGIAYRTILIQNAKYKKNEEF